MSKQILVMVILLLVASMQCGIAQTALKDDSAPNVYSLPFASSGNTIELTVANTGLANMTGVKVLAAEFPSWIKFSATEQNIAVLKSQQEMPATFSFAVDKTAPDGEHFVFVKVLPPANYEIFLMSLKSGQQTRLTYNDAFDGFPALSPDGTLLTFDSNRDAKPGERKLRPYLMDVSSLNLGPKKK